MKVKGLKRRIKHVITISILISVLIFIAVLSFSSVRAERSQGYLLASMISNMTAGEIFSDEVLLSLNIADFDSLKSDSYEALSLVRKLRNFEDKVISSYWTASDTAKALIMPGGLNPILVLNSHDFRHNEITKGPFAIGEIAQIRVSIRGNEIYKSEHWGSSFSRNSFSNRPVYPFISLLNDYFQIEAVCHVAKSPGIALPDNKGAPFATVTVRLDPGFFVSYYIHMMLGIVSSAIIAVIIAGFFAIFLSRSVSNPFCILETKLKSLALEDYETTIRSQILVKKRPLVEIKSIADSTNTIIRKMLQFNSLQLHQNSRLESLKNELESQKEELLESKQMIQDAQAQLVQSQNLASIGQLTAAISHEINEPLDHIHMSVHSQDELADRLQEVGVIRDNPEYIDLVSQLKDAGDLNCTAFERISSIIRSLNNFSRLDLSEKEETDINESLQSVVLLTSNLWKRRINIHGDYGDIPAIMSYPGLINQVFMNIVVNAIHAIPDKGDIFIKTSHDSDFLIISIRDTGTGIEDEILPLIFETGFTTKKSGSGSGLGLSISRSIIKKHDGKIDVHSKPGDGAEFVITLPLTKPARPATPA